jgi:rRNA maturation endonuclease Nob1
MAKLKIDVKRAILSKDNNGILTIKGFEDEEIPFENLSEKIDEMIALNEPLNIKFTKGRKSAGAGRKPSHKYKCEKCAKEITSKEDGLHIECKDCGCEFIQET